MKLHIFTKTALYYKLKYSKYISYPYKTLVVYKEKYNCGIYFAWNSCKHSWQLQDPSGGDDNGGDKQYIW